MAIEDAVLERLKASRSKVATAPRAITGVLQQTTFPSLERPKAKAQPAMPALPSFSEPAPAEPPIVVPEPMVSEPENEFDAFLRNSRSGW